MSHPLARIVLTLALGAIGATLATLLRLPAPLITGPAVLVTIAALAGVAGEIPVALRNGVFVVIGMVMGSAVTPQTLEAALKWPLSFVCLALALVAIIWLAKGLLVWRFAQHPRTALLAVAPGHLSFVLGLGAESGGDLRIISVAQSIRLLLLTLAVPVAISFAGYDLQQAASAAETDMDLLPLAMVLGVSALCGWVLFKLHVPAAFLLGGMGLSALVHATGIAEGNAPQWLSVPSYAIMGALIGSRFAGVTLEMLRASALAGVGATAVAGAVAALFALAAAQLTGLDVATLLIAFAPGGVETMSAMALLMHADPALVAAHHVFRLLVLTFLIPAWLAVLPRPEPTNT